MRISSLSYFTSSLPSMQANQSQISRLGQQISTGQRMLAARDDPLSAGKALQLSSRIAVREQDMANQQKAGLALDYESNVLQAMDKSLTDARALLAQSSSSDTQAVRYLHAELLKGMYLQIKDLANSHDTEGHYLFAGFNTNLGSLTPPQLPFEHTQVYPAIAASAGTTYNGTADGAQISSQGVRSINIDEGRSVQVSDNLENVFKFPAPVNIPYYDTGTGSVTNVATNDVFQALDQIAIVLRDTNLSPFQVDTAVNDAVNAIAATLDRIGGIERRVAAARLEVNDVSTSTQGLQLIDQNAFSDLTLVDKAAAIVELQTRQTTLEAAQQAYAQSSRLSLFSYL